MNTCQNGQIRQTDQSVEILPFPESLFQNASKSSWDSGTGHPSIMEAGLVFGGFMTTVRIEDIFH
jgi:hypothetical protein